MPASRPRKSSKRSPFHFDGSAPVVVLVCRDSFLRSHYTGEIVQTLESLHGEIDRFDFDGDEVAPGDILEELQAVGLLHPHKLVMIDKADRFLASSSQVKGPSRSRQLLEAYAGSPSEGSTLLLRAESWHAGKLDKLVDVFRVSVEDENEAARWCVQRASKAYDATLELTAASLLVRRVGLDLGRLDGELNKLGTIVSGRSITTVDIREAVGASREEEAWAIKAAVLLDGPDGSLEVLREIFDLSRTRKDVPAFWAIIELLRTIHAASVLSRRGISGWELKQAAGLFDRKSERKTADEIVKVSQNMDPREAARRLREALAVQVDLRKGIGDPRYAVEGLAVGLADRLKGLRSK